MRKRFVLLLALLCLGATAVAVAPWTVQWASLSGGVERQLRKAFGLDLQVTGRSTIAFLPVPRVKFDGITVNAGDGTPLVTGGQLRGEFRIWPLLVGEFRLTELSLSGSRIEVPVDAEGRSRWHAVLGHVAERLGRGGEPGVHLRRLILADATLVVTEAATGRQTIVDDVDLVANWPRPEAGLDVTGTVSWRGEAVGVALQDASPAALLAGRPSRLALRVSAPTARLQLAGELNPRAEPAGEVRFAGQAAFEARSLREFGRWAGVALPLGAVLNGAALEGAIEAGARGSSWNVSWPQARLQLGPDRLNGALQARFEGGRLAVTGTLAADTLALTDLLGTPGPARGGGGWSGEGIDLAALTGADLDLRLSAGSARLGGLRLADLAGGVLVKPGRVEATLGRATLGQGLVKGRLNLLAARDGVDLRVNGNFERVDVGILLTDLGQPRWLAGRAAGQIAVEASGASPAELVRATAGRGSVVIRGGEIGGVTLAEVLRRAESRPLSAFLDWRGGRTAFDQVQQSWTISAGVAELEGTLTAPGLQGAVQGRVSGVERNVSLRATVGAGSADAKAASSAIVFDIHGPWDDVAVVPDARALIGRSGAARPLLPASTQ